MMRRREFITLLGGAAAAWPLAARAQQPAKLPTIGFLGVRHACGRANGPPPSCSGLRELGWIEGRNVAIEYRWAEGRTERLPRSRPSSSGSRSTSLSRSEPAQRSQQSRRPRPSRSSSRLAADPVGTGLVASLARPGGNVTGLSLPGSRSCWQAARTLARGRPSVSAGWRSWPMPAIRSRAGDARGSGSGRARSASKSSHARNPARGGYRARLRGAQGRAPMRSMSCATRS